jgi:hypothetical protein
MKGHKAGAVSRRMHRIDGRLRMAIEYGPAELGASAVPIECALDFAPQALGDRRSTTSWPTTRHSRRIRWRFETNRLVCSAPRRLRLVRQKTRTAASVRAGRRRIASSLVRTIPVVLAGVAKPDLVGEKLARLLAVDLGH